MTYQDIFNALSELECVFYYAADEADHMNATLDEMHSLIRRAADTWSEYTGTTLDTNDTRRFNY